MINPKCLWNKSLLEVNKTLKRDGKMTCGDCGWTVTSRRDFFVDGSGLRKICSRAKLEEEKIYIFKRPDHYVIPFKTLEEAMRTIETYEGKPYSDNAWEIVEQKLGYGDDKTIGASVCVKGRYKWLEGEELLQWQNDRSKW